MEFLVREALNRKGYLLHDIENDWFAAERKVQSLSSPNRTIIEGKSSARVITIEKHNDEIELYMDNGWQVNLKLDLSEPSMISDVRVVGVPVM